MLRPLHAGPTPQLSFFVSTTATSFVHHQNERRTPAARYAMFWDVFASPVRRLARPLRPPLPFVHLQRHRGTPAAHRGML
ncbi:hypothetical protein M407DRAFT_107839 [Tulasnella calospora MUT 4182]|uniref:Uncharacterized protein n=1 Tax=Tulasnella calospora MUT 4182 TaxID=1051891 RepID=A0A0C3KQE3_9AGAM|nr:hypothetical protein M407DRAFT_107839 [Tulasnella calospora MUT 4182]